MAEAEVAIVVSPRNWAERLHRFLADHGGARVRARVIDAREALDDVYAVLVVEDLTSFLTPRLIGELRARGRRVLGVHEPDEPWARQRLVDLGVDATIEADATPEGFVRAIDALAATADVDARFSQIVSEELATLAPVVASHAPTRGTVIAVGAPPGGCGATEVAIELAAAAAHDGPTALVDADEFAPSIAQRLGMSLHPNLRSAIDALEHRTGRVDDTLRSAPGSTLEVLAGLPHGRDWHEVRASDIVGVIDELVAARVVVANVGHGVEDLVAQGAPPRFAVTRALLGRADRIVAVGTPTPVGVARLLDWVATVRVLAPLTPIAIVVNRAPAQRFKRAELAAEITRSFAPTTLAFAPEDRRVSDAAWDGTLATTGRFSRAVGRLLVELDVRVPAVATRSGVSRSRRG